MVISVARLLIAYIAIALRGRYAIGIFSQSISLAIPTQYVLTKAQEANGDRCVIAGVGEAVRLCAIQHICRIQHIYEFGLLSELNSGRSQLLSVLTSILFLFPNQCGQSQIVMLVCFTKFVSPSLP